MTKKNLPIKLKKEPLIDVVCGVRFKSEQSAEGLLPGLLMPKLDGKKFTFDPLPVSQLPKPVRDNDPTLRNVPLVRFLIESKFVVLIGSNSLAVGCQMPYPGWHIFREMVETIFSVLQEAPFVSEVEGYSLKYVDFIPTELSDQDLNFFNLKINIANRRLTKEPTQIRTEISEPPFVHAATIISSAQVHRGDSAEKNEGSIIDIDTHRIEVMEKQKFIAQLPGLLDAIHLANKELFFDFLSDAGLAKLEPDYAL